jgi:hypothetical protein
LFVFVSDDASGTRFTNTSPIDLKPATVNQSGLDVVTFTGIDMKCAPKSTRTDECVIVYARNEVHKRVAVLSFEVGDDGAIVPSALTNGHISPSDLAFSAVSLVRPAVAYNPEQGTTGEWWIANPYPELGRPGHPYFGRVFLHSRSGPDQAVPDYWNAEGGSELSAIFGVSLDYVPYTGTFVTAYWNNLNLEQEDP